MKGFELLPHATSKQSADTERSCFTIPIAAFLSATIIFLVAPFREMPGRGATFPETLALEYAKVNQGTPARPWFSRGRCKGDPLALCFRLGQSQSMVRTKRF
ncbi:hypothetical protein [Aquicoccus sp.]|uniref:hypothetical protein n=1 Tax=Aquicoccus sp. TaxID=2055851 RepID=UPI00356ABFC8